MQASAPSHDGQSSQPKEGSQAGDEILNVRGEVAKRRKALPALVDRIGRYLAHPYFFLGFLVFHLGWIVLNLRLWPWQPWDPYPFTFLATIASAEAPFLALLVLMFQQRSARIDELRGEIDLQVCLHIEREISMSLRLLQELQEKLQVDSQQDREQVERMKEYLDPQRLMSDIRRELEVAEGHDEATSP